MQATNLQQFEVGKRYAMTFIGNSDLHVIYEVVGRTKCMVSLDDGSGKVIRRKVRPSWDRTEEVCDPLGSYSFSPSVGANDCSRRLGGFLPEQLPVGVFSTGMGP